jgi:hypothetical protein
VDLLFHVAWTRAEGGKGLHIVQRKPIFSIMKEYRGRIEGGRRIVTVDGKPLPKLYPSNLHRNVEFEWGSASGLGDSLRCASPGEVHLAEAILANLSGSSFVDPLAGEFATEHISTLGARWMLPSGEIEKWLRLRRSIAESTASGSDSRDPVRVATDFPSFSGRINSFQDRIKPEELVKRGFPRPDDVLVSRNKDSTGDEAFYIYLVFPDKTPDRALAWDKVEPMVSWVQNLVWTETGGLMWPYVKIKRHKELTGSLD